MKKEQLNKVKELSYINYEKEENTKIGFEYKSQWITNPFLEASGRFEFANYEEMCSYYGKTNVEEFIEKILFLEEIKNYVLSIGGNNEDVEQITEEVITNDYTTMEEVKKHIENYYL